MKHEGGNEMRRWRDRPGCGTTVEDRAADLVRGSLGPREPDPERLLRIEHRLRRRNQRPHLSRLSVRMAVVAIVLIACAATVKAYELARRVGWLGHTSAVSKTPAEIDPGRSPPRRHVPPLHGGPAAAVPTESPTASDGARSSTLLGPPGSPGKFSAAAWTPPSPTKAPTLALRTTPVQRATRAAPTRQVPEALLPAGSAAAPRGGAWARFSDEAAATPVPSQSTPVHEQPLNGGAALSPPPAAEPSATPPVASTAPGTEQARPAWDEVRALEQAIALLRRGHDGEAALSALDDYLARYPHGLLNREARFARVDALLLLSRSDQALSALEALPLDRGRRSTELQVIRAELRARHDCASAESDFTAALNRSPSACLLDRILYGRGLCRARLGNVSGAASDLQSYVDRSPGGPHAASARQWLESHAEELGHAAQP